MDATAKRKRGRPRTSGPTTAKRSAGRPKGQNGSVGSDALIGMALALLSERAPSDITRMSLARHAEVDPSLIRYYFKNRDSLMRTVAATLTRELQQRASAATDVEGLSPPDQISARARVLLAFKLDNPFYHRLMMEEMARSEDKESRALFDGIASSAIARYRNYLAKGAADGSLRNVDPGFLYMAMIGLCDFFVTASPVLMKHLDERTQNNVDKKYAAFICDLLLNGLRPRQTDGTLKANERVSAS